LGSTALTAIRGSVVRTVPGQRAAPGVARHLTSTARTLLLASAAAQNK
jgi:hypothetical protein